MRDAVDEAMSCDAECVNTSAGFGAIGETAMTALCIAPSCGDVCDGCNCALTPEQVAQYAKRYTYLRERNLDTISRGGVFAGMTPENVVLNGDDLDAAIDAAMEDNV